MSIKNQVLSALRWTATARFAGQVATWAITIYVIRILTPDDYALVSMAAVMIGFAILINELGVIPALIQAEDIDDTIVRQVYGFVLAFNAILFAIVFVSAPFFAAFFNDERLIDIVRVLGSILLITALGAVPTAMLQRDIRFKGISIVEFASMIAGSATTLGLAVSGHGVWSLILGNIAQVTTKTIGILIVSRFMIMPSFRFAGLGRYFSFGAKVTGQKILWYANSQIDIILIGKLLGNQALGLYSVSYHLATMPMSKFLMIVNQVAFPAYSRLQSDVPLAREYFFKSVRLTALLFFPLLWGLSSVSAEFVETFLGDQWIAGSLCLAIVTLAVPFRVMSMLLSPVVDGLGHPGVGLRNLLTFSALLPAAMAVGTNWGIVGVSCGLVGASAVALIINFHRSLPLLGSSLREMFHSLVPSMLSGAVMYGAVLTTKVYLLAGMAAPGRLAVLIAVGAGVYGAMTMLINRDVAFGSVRLLRAGA